MGRLSVLLFDLALQVCDEHPELGTPVTGVVEPHQVVPQEL